MTEGWRLPRLPNGRLAMTKEWRLPRAPSGALVSMGIGFLMVIFSLYFYINNCPTLLKIYSPIFE
jgi:hypothetical protein